MKFTGSPESTAVCASRKNCSYSVVPWLTPCAARPALIWGAKVGDSRSRFAMPPPGMASVAVRISAEGMTPRNVPPSMAPSEWPR